jgi:hypothetical protein
LAQERRIFVGFRAVILALLNALASEMSIVSQQSGLVFPSSKKSVEISKEGVFTIQDIEWPSHRTYVLHHVQLTQQSQFVLNRSWRKSTPPSEFAKVQRYALADCLVQRVQN